MAQAMLCAAITDQVAQFEEKRNSITSDMDGFCATIPEYREE